ncbi:MAG: zf-HC2 domain-containing protein [Acidobacteria bacterium]|nr:zf-HC2 domain-containing protein [Acidobacteriota bacterium]
MEPRPEDLEELEALWRRGAVPTGPCPSSGVLARGAAGELPHAERAAFAEHVASCETCAEIVRLFPDVKSWADRASTRLGAARPKMSFRTLWPLAAAAVVVLAAGLVVVSRFRPAGSPSYRAGAAVELRSLLEPDRPLPRAAFRLRWTPGPAGSRYSVLVAKEDLTPVARAEGLTVPEFLVEDRLLADLPTGSNVVWNVRSTSPDSPGLSSPTFVTTVE